MDLLSDLLLSIGVEATAIATFELGEPWATSVDSFQFLFCYRVVEGGCWFLPKGGSEHYLRKGECVVGIRCPAFSLLSERGLVPTNVEEIWAKKELPHLKDGTPSLPMTVQWGGNGSMTRLLALVVALRTSVPRGILQFLPDYFFLSEEAGARIPGLELAIDFLLAERGQQIPGHCAIANELATLAFRGLIRAGAIDSAGQSAGWMRALSDKKISRALAAIHADHTKPWSVNALAREAGMSRSAFAVRFRDLTGQTPLSYIAAWRMGHAADRLRDRNVKLSQLVEEFGYRSERVFRRAFKQYVGESPREFRKTMGAPDRAR